MKRIVAHVFFVCAMTMAMSGLPRAQCERAMLLASGYLESDNLVRLAVHFGDPSSVPGDIVCSRSMLPGDTRFEVPICAYNLDRGIQYLEFSVESNESLGVFIPDGCFGMVSSSKSYSAGRWHMDLALQSGAPCCGPVDVGAVEIVRAHGSDPIWIDLKPNGQSGKMYALDAVGEQLSVFPPMHGGFIGQRYLYACQEPICEEPNAPVTGFVAEKSPGCAVKLSWTAGSGNRTMVRYRTDMYPTGPSDGELAVETTSVAGETQFFFHTGIANLTRVYYKAFSLTRDAGDNIVRESFVECSSMDTTQVKCEIAVKPASWGAIKSLYR